MPNNQYIVSIAEEMPNNQYIVSIAEEMPNNQYIVSIAEEMPNSQYIVSIAEEMPNSQYIMSIAEEMPNSQYIVSIAEEMPNSQYIVSIAEEMPNSQYIVSIAEEILLMLDAVSGRKHPSTIQVKQLKTCLPMMPVLQHLISSQVFRPRIVNDDCLVDIGRFVNHVKAIDSGTTQIQAATGEETSPFIVLSYRV